MNISSYAAVARAPFLILSVTLVAVGAAAGAVDGAFDLTHTLLALVGLVALHVAVNAFNEASDFLRGIDMQTERTPFSGGSGTLPGGVLNVRAAFAVGAAGSLVGAAVGAYFLIVIGWPMLPLVLLGALSVLGYSDLLARLYVGEFFAGLGLGALPVLGAALVQSGQLGPTGVAASVPAFFMTFNLLLLNEFPDQAADRAGGRRNLVLLLGRRGAAWVYVLSALAVPAYLLVTAGWGFLPALATVAVLPSLLLTGPLRWAISRSEEPVPVSALAANVGWILATNTVLAIALAI